ncbi:MAG: PAS domain-containing protein [Nevskiaceae bacterium]|jgi:two-component system nitrogen regulation sensor histidine kinase GlnL|nr:PAS domain-containing protein [Nevskiaceae bacterium]
MSGRSFDPAELLDTLSVGVAVLDGQLRLIYLNAAAQDLMAVSAKQAQGRVFGDLFADAGELTLLLNRSLARLEICAWHEISLSDQIVVDLIVTPLDKGAEGVHLLVELIDATRRQRIFRNSDMLERIDGSRLMIRQLAHEVKNPLGGLRGAAQLLERELSDPALREYTAVIIAEADRLSALVDAMAGSSQPARKALLNVHELCEHVMALLRAEAPQGMRIERDYDPSVPEALFDRDQVVQALLNVARNAMQAAGAQGHVTLRTRIRHGANIGAMRHRLAVVIEVEDNGQGVPPELARSLFLPLVTGRPNGTGIGLAVAQDLIARNGGIIEYTSQPGFTVFRLILPLEGAMA